MSGNDEEAASAVTQTDDSPVLTHDEAEASAVDEKLEPLASETPDDTTNEKGNQARQDESVAQNPGPGQLNEENESYFRLLADQPVDRDDTIKLPARHHITVVEFDGQRFEPTELRGSAKLLRNGTLAYVMEKARTDNKPFDPIRMVFPAASVKKCELSENVMTLRFQKYLTEVIHPPTVNTDECKELFIAIQESNNPEIKLHIAKLHPVSMELLLCFAKKLTAHGTFAVAETVLAHSNYVVIHHVDYQSLQIQAALEEIEKKASNAEVTFGGVLEEVRLESAKPDESVVLVKHPEQQRADMLFAQIDEDQGFILHFPDGTKLEAMWPKDYMGDCVSSKVFKLRIPGITDRHRNFINGYLKNNLSDLGCGFRLEAVRNRSEEARCRKILRNLIQSYRTGNGFPIAPILYTHPDRRLGTEVEASIAEILDTSLLSRLQRVSAVHALCKAEQLPAGIALITGAAGTGKTYTAATIIKAASVSEGFNRIVVTAKQNMALERIFQSVMDILPNAKKSAVLYIQGKLAADKMQISGSAQLRGLVKKFNIGGRLEELKDSRTSKRRLIISRHQIIFATLDIMQRYLDSEVFPANFVLIDEAASTSELDSLIPITKFNKTMKRLVLVGDAMQLRPYSPANNPVTKRSLLLRCQQSEWAIARLIDNYRMHPDTAAPIRSIFYNTESMAQFGLMKPSTTETSLLENTEMAKSIAGSLAMREVLQEFNKNIKSLTSWWDVPGKERRRGKSFSNEAEIEAILILLNHIKESTKMNAEGLTMGKIAVITPYLGQVHDIKEAVSERFPTFLHEGLEIAAVDSFGEREKSIVIVSLVRSNESHEVGFLNDAHRLCTMLSRARLCQVVIGNFDFIKAQVKGKYDGIKAKEVKQIVETGKQGEYKDGKHKGRPLWHLVNKYRWQRFRDHRIEDFLKPKEVTELEATKAALAAAKEELKAVKEQLAALRKDAGSVVKQAT